MTISSRCSIWNRLRLQRHAGVLRRAGCAGWTRQHGDEREHVDQSLRGGTQTLGNLFRPGRNALVDGLRLRIEEAVRRYIASLPQDARHPFLRRGERNFRFAGSWSSRLKDQGISRQSHPPRRAGSVRPSMSLCRRRLSDITRQARLDQVRRTQLSTIDLSRSGAPCRAAAGRTAGAVSVLYMAWHGAVSRASKSHHHCF